MGRKAFKAFKVFKRTRAKRPVNNSKRAYFNKKLAPTLWGFTGPLRGFHPLARVYPCLPHVRHVAGL